MVLVGVCRCKEAAQKSTQALVQSHHQRRGSSAKALEGSKGKGRGIAREQVGAGAWARARGRGHTQWRRDEEELSGVLLKYYGAPEVKAALTEASASAGPDAAVSDTAAEMTPVEGKDGDGPRGKGAEGLKQQNDILRLLMEVEERGCDDVDSRSNGKAVARREGQWGDEAVEAGSNEGISVRQSGKAMAQHVNVRLPGRPWSTRKLRFETDHEVTASHTCR